MDKQRPNPSSSSSASPESPTIPGGTDIEGLVRVSSDSNVIGEPSTVQQVEGPPPNLGDDGGSRGSAPEGPSDAGNRELRSPSPNRTSPPNFTADGPILQTIAERFNKAREIGKNSAWRQLQTDLMDASPYICPALIPYKDLLSAVADIEKEIKGSAQQVGKSNEELLSEFLNGEGTITLLDNGDNMPSGEESSLGSAGTT